MTSRGLRWPGAAELDSSSCTPAPVVVVGMMLTRCVCEASVAAPRCLGHGVWDRQVHIWPVINAGCLLMDWHLAVLDRHLAGRLTAANATAQRRSAQDSKRPVKAAAVQDSSNSSSSHNNKAKVNNSKQAVVVANLLLAQEQQQQPLQRPNGERKARQLRPKRNMPSRTRRTERWPYR